MRLPFVRFLLVGVLNTAVGLIVTFGVRYGLGWGYWPATLAGLIAGGFVSFLLNRSFTFRSNAPVGRALPRFVVVTLICYWCSFAAGYRIASAAELWLPTGMVNIDDVAVVLGTGMYAVMNYWGQKMFVFRRMELQKVRDQPVR